MEKKINNQLVGIAGTYMVAGELTLRGWTAMPTIKNVKGPDILASKGEKVIQIETKTKGPWKKPMQWPLRKTAANLEHDNMYYILVSLNVKESPDYYILPSCVVADYIKRENKLSIAKAKELGRVKESTIRGFPYPKHNDSIKLEDWKDRWDLLEK